MKYKKIRKQIAIVLILSIFAAVLGGCARKETVTAVRTTLVGANQKADGVVNETYEEGKRLKTIGGETLDAANERYVPLIGFGFAMMIPEAWGQLTYLNLAAVETGIVYMFMPPSVYGQMLELGEDIDEDAFAEIYAKQLELVKIFYAEADKKEADVKAGQTGYANVEKLATLNDKTYYIAYNNRLTEKDLKIFETDEDKRTFEAYAAAIPEVKKSIAIFPVQELASEQSMTSEAMDGFSGVDLDGNALDSSIFAYYDLTMINIWATWCGPCVSELPDLASLYDNLPENVNLVTVCEDGDTESEAAKEFLAECGAKFRTLAADDAVRGSLLRNVYSYPTTIFVDKNGEIVGDAVYGSADEAFYRSEIEARLK